jgi:integrase
LRRVKPGTLNRELDILRHAFATARRNWDVPLTHNAFADVVRPRGSAPRERRLIQGEQERLLSSCAACRNPYVRSLVQLALETAMRRGELLKMCWCDLDSRTLHIPVTKNGHARTIPLSSGALAILQALSNGGTSHPPDNSGCSEDGLEAVDEKGGACGPEVSRLAARGGRIAKCPLTTRRRH